MHLGSYVTRLTTEASQPFLSNQMMVGLEKKGREPANLTIQEVPIGNTVIDVAITLHDLGEELSQEIVVRCFFKPKLAHVIQVYAEFL